MAGRFLKALWRSAWPASPDNEQPINSGVFSSPLVFGGTIAFILFVTLISAFLIMTPGDYRFVSDFDVFHIAGELIWQGHLLEIYDPIVFQNFLEDRTGSRAGYMWMYPPYYAFVTAPLGLFPRNLSYLLFILLSLGFYLIILRRLIPSYINLPLLACLPAIMITAMIGQNGFLLAGLAGLAIQMHMKDQNGAGLPMALLSFKPQIAIGAGLVFLMKFRWKPILLGVGLGVGMVVITTIVFGLQVWERFMDGLRQSSAMMESGSNSLEEFISVYALLNSLGFSEQLSLIIHGLVLLMSLGLLINLHRRHWSIRELSGLSLILFITASPKVLAYDVIFISMAYAVLGQSLISKCRPLELPAIIVLTWLATLHSYFQKMAFHVLGLDVTPLAIGWIPIAIITGWVIIILSRSEDPDGVDDPLIPSQENGS